jgi:predicted lipid-binding transport protein (Tim44 family)
MPNAASDFDPRIIERFAEQLMAKADSTRVGFGVGGGIFGVLVGAVPLTPLQSVWHISGAFAFASILIGGMIGVLLGYVVGEGRAFRYRVQAQMALFQVEIEKKVAAAVAPRRAVVRPPAAAPAPSPAPASAPAPAAVQPAPPVPSPTPARPAQPEPAMTPRLEPIAPGAPVAPMLRPPSANDGLPPLSQPPAVPPVTPAASA